MTIDVLNRSAAKSASGSERVALARVSRDAALSVAGVVITDDGPAGRFMTVGGGERVGGVTCVASADGGYDVALHVRCEPVALLELAEHVKIAVRRAAASSGLMLSDLEVGIVDVVDPGWA